MRAVVVSLVLLLSAGLAARADNLKFKNGRLDEGPVTILSVTPDQVITIRTKRVAVLTAKQRAVLQKEAGKVPAVLEVYTVKGAEVGIHGCFAYNVAVWFVPDKIEVPHRYLLTDAEAAARADELDEME